MESSGYSTTIGVEEHGNRHWCFDRTLKIFPPKKNVLVDKIWCPKHSDYQSHYMIHNRLNDAYTNSDMHIYTNSIFFKRETDRCYRWCIIFV